MHYLRIKKGLSIALALSGALLAGCTLLSPQTLRPGTTAQATEQATGTSAGVSTGSLTWQGPPSVDPARASLCASLEINGGQATVGTCEGAKKTAPLAARYGQEWAAIQAHFAPFTYAANGNKLVFDGVGDTNGGAWERALLAWARARYAELSSGKVSAAANTVVSWFPGQVMEAKDTCRHLTVLSWGYAYAQTVRCGGNDLIESVEGWLDTDKMEQLDTWLYQRAALYQDNSYIAGAGEQMMSEAETSQAAQWAADVWAGLWATKTTAAPAELAAVAPPANAPAACAGATADTQLWVDAAGGYCLLYPASHIVDQTTPGQINIVVGSVMNHTDPRVSVTVEDAAGRSLQQVGDELAANFELPGTPVERASITVDGVDAIMLDNLPGQDLNRRVAFIQNGKLYSLFFTPLGEPGAARAAMEAFYQGIVDSFRFLQASVATPAPDSAIVEVSPTDVQYILANVNVNIRSGPGTNYRIIGKVFAGQTEKVTGVTADGSWWRVMCPDDTDGSCWVIADPALTQPTTAS